MKMRVKAETAIQYEKYLFVARQYLLLSIGERGRYGEEEGDTKGLKNNIPWYPHQKRILNDQKLSKDSQNGRRSNQHDQKPYIQLDRRPVIFRTYALDKDFCDGRSGG